MSIISAIRMVHTMYLLYGEYSKQSSSFHLSLPTRTRSISTVVRAFAPKQVGSDFIGCATSIALSSNGNRVAIGGEVLIGTGTGRVRVFDWKGSQWAQVGPDFVGSRRLGQGVALSSDGNRVAIGTPSPENKDYHSHVRIYDWEESQWTQVGSDLVGVVAGDWFGSDIAMSSDGNRVAIVSYLTNTRDGTSHVQIFDWGDGQWTQVGSNLNVDVSGISIALSSDGNRVAIGSRYSENNSTRIYDWTGKQWTQVGSNLVGQAAGDWFGQSVALSSDGNRIAVGAPWHNDRTGYVRIFDWVGNQWTQVGPDVVGRTTDDFFGWCIALTSDGNRVVIGAPNLRKSGHAGHVEMYDWTGHRWRKQGCDFVGQAGQGGFGKTVVISSCGHRAAIVAYCNSGIGTSYVRVYDLGESCS